MTAHGLITLMHYIILFLIVIVRAILISFGGYGLFSILREARSIWKTGGGDSTCLEMVRYFVYVGLAVSGLVALTAK